jgi:hypothetical protein
MPFAIGRIMLKRKKTGKYFENVKNRDYKGLQELQKVK